MGAAERQALEEEVCELRNKLIEARQGVCDTALQNETMEVEQVTLAVKARKTLKGHLNKIFSMDWALNSRHLLSASQDGKLIVWDSYTTIKEAAIPLKSSWVMTCGYAPSGNFVACGGLDNLCTIYNLQKKDDVGACKITKELLGHDGYISNCRFLSDTQILTSSGDRTTILWDIETGRQTTVLEGHEGEINSIALQTPGSSVFVSGSTDKKNKLWDIREGMCKQTFDGHESDINTVSWMSNTHNFGSGGEDATSRLFDIRSDQQLAVYGVGEPGTTGISSVAFSKSGRILFAGSNDFSVYVWDVLRLEGICRLEGHENRVSSLGVNDDGSALCTASWDSFLKVWN